MRSLLGRAPLTLTHNRTEDSEVLAIAAHYDRSRDRFLIATGVTNPPEDSAVTLWVAAEGPRVAWWSFRWLPGREFCLVCAPAKPDMYTYTEALPIVHLVSDVWVALGHSCHAHRSHSRRLQTLVTLYVTTLRVHTYAPQHRLPALACLFAPYSRNSEVVCCCCGTCTE